MDALVLAELKASLRLVLDAASQTLATHATLPDLLGRLGMREGAVEHGASKRDRVRAAFANVSDEELPTLAERYIAACSPRPTVRNELQEFIWTGAPGPRVPERYRRELARALSTEDLRAPGLMDLLERLWVLDEVDFLATEPSLGDRIRRHVLKDPDYEPEQVFEEVGAYGCSDRRFVLFLEGLCSHRFRPDAAEQGRIAERMNDALRDCGVELVSDGVDGGYPVFRLISTASAGAGPAKQVIFAPLEKPDLRFADAVNNDVELVSSPDKTLVYDRPISIGGLSWRELQTWWAERSGRPDDREAAVALYQRLLNSLPPKEISPPQRLLFSTFYTAFKSDVPRLPALLPEVYVHYDPKTVAARGRAAALVRQRLDFLMFLPNHVRVVIEVDGDHHYADNGRADPHRYAQMVSEDRKLRLRGYEVFRFGAVELKGDRGKVLVAEFFRRLFALHDIAVGT